MLAGVRTQVLSAHSKVHGGGTVYDLKLRLSQGSLPDTTVQVPPPPLPTRRGLPTCAYTNARKRQLLAFGTCTPNCKFCLHGIEHEDATCPSCWVGVTGVVNGP